MELYRFQSEILMKLFERRTPVNADLLCREAKMSVNSLRKTIDEINLACADYGMQIVSKTGSGYLIEVTDPLKYQSFSRAVMSRYYRNQFFRDSSTDTVHFILRRLLSGKKTMLSDIADELFVSVSTVNRYMREVKRHLNDYGLTLVNHTNSGLVVEGSEWRYRLSLANEYQIYHDFKVSDEYIPEDAFEQLFLSGGTYRRNVNHAVRTVLLEEKYLLPFDNAREFSDLLVLAVTRKKFSSRLEEDCAVFRGKNYGKELAIITRILQQIPEEYSFQLNETERLLLCSYLKASRIVYKENLGESANAAGCCRLASEFLERTADHYGIPLEVSQDKQTDFICNLVMLVNRTEAGIHKNPREIRSIRADGLLTMELCIDFYEYIHEKTKISCTAEDALGFYYIFSGMLDPYYHDSLKRILLVSRYGYYYSKNVAATVNRMSKKEMVEFIPMEYLQLSDALAQQYSGIATDIDEIRQIYHGKTPVYMIHYLRKYQDAFDLIQRVLCPVQLFTEQYFRRQDLIYEDTIDDIETAYRFIASQFSSASKDQKADYVASLKAQDGVFPSVRKRCMLLIHERHGIIPEFMFKIIIPSAGMTAFSNERISYIVAVNTPGKNVQLLHDLYSKVAELLHSDGIIFSGNRDEDYQLLIDVMYRHNHII